MIIIERHRHDQNARGVLSAVVISSSVSAFVDTRTLTRNTTLMIVLLKKVFVYDLLLLKLIIVLLLWSLNDSYRSINNMT